MLSEPNRRPWNGRVSTTFERWRAGESGWWSRNHGRTSVWRVFVEVDDGAVTLVVNDGDAGRSDRFGRVLLGERERDAVLQAYREDGALVGPSKTSGRTRQGELTGTADSYCRL